MDASSRTSPELVVGTWIDPNGKRAEWSAPDASPTLVEQPADVPVSARILVVEDEHVVALDLQVRLARMGHLVVVTHSGEEAVEKAAEMPFDLVLMDIKLKGAMDGVEAARTIRRAFDVPIIYLTAYADNHTLDRARYTEPYGYILKPFQERELKAAIEIALQRHAHDRMRSEQQRLQRFLADASAHMATSLDYRAIAHVTCELIVPRYADWCLIHLRERNDTIPAFSYAQPGGSDGALTHARIIETVEGNSRAELLTQIPDAISLRDALGAEHLDVLRELGARSMLCVPLVARQQVLGAIALVSGRMRARYGPHDLAFVEDLAQRLAMALDNALLYRQAERAIVMRDDVLAIVSHDLRTPLSTILMQAEALTEDPDVQEVGRAISRSAERMNRLIGDLVDASAINAGRFTLDRGTHRVDELVTEAVEPFRSLADLRGISLEVAAERLLVSCDHDRILQVLSNLIDNALRFTPRKGRVIVSAHAEDSHVRFMVHDTGRGIALDALPHLFDRFWRLRSRRDGAGLGLFIAKGIITAHGSSLGVDTTLGVGSKFFFDLPVGD